MRRRLIRGAVLTAFTLAAPAAVAAQTARRRPRPPPCPQWATARRTSRCPAPPRPVAAGPLRLSDFRGKTVVLAFFFKARTKG